MKLKYYLRGLGIGIVVTAVIMGVSGNDKSMEMTDAQIVARAKELGMVDGVLSQLEKTEPSEEAQSAEVQSEEVQPEAERTETVPPETDQTETVLPETVQPEEADTAKTEPDSKAEDSSKAEEVSEPEVVEKVVVTVYPGEGSYTVSRKLAALGLVESADIYDKFLCQNGYDKKITTGNHEIETGMTAEEIAKALTTR